MSESEALMAARREFGPVSSTKEQCRDLRRIGLLEDVMRDLAFAFRALKKSPVFTLAALLSLALGIGANTAIYSFTDAVMLRSLPVPDPQNLIVLNWRAKGSPAIVHELHGDGSGLFPYPAWELLRTNNDKLAALFAFAGAGRLNLVAANQAFLGNGEYVSANYFSTIAVPASIGRVINQNDDRAGAAPVAVVSYQLWQHYFNGAANAVGQTVLVNRNAFTIIGVTAPEFFGVDLRDAPDVFLPLHSLSYLDARAHGSNWFVQRDNYWVEVMGRLRSGVTLQQAQVPIAAQFQSFAASNAVNDAERSNLPALWLHNGGSGIDSLRRRYSKPLYVLMAMTGLILAIACANVANLLLARSPARRREIAVRISLGAARSRIMRQLLTESVLLSLLGGLMGMLVAKLGIRFLTFLLSDTLYARIDARVLLFAIVVSGATGIVFGLAPAIQATKVDVMPALKDSRVSALRLPRLGVHLGLSQMLIAGQIASSLLLIIAAGLFVTTLFNLQSVSIGFNKQNLLVFNINAAQAGYDEKRAQIFYESLRRRLSNTPGALAATMSSIALVSNSSDSSGILLPGISAPQGRGPSTSVTIVGPSFFHTMQIPFLHGRPISEQDTDAAARVVVVNEVFAKKYFPGRSPIGEHFAFGFEKPIDVRIIGVAKNSLYSSLVGEVPPLTYLPWSQPLPGFLYGMYYEIRTFGDPVALSNTVRQIVREANPQLPVAHLATQARYIDATIAPERTFANLCTCLSLLALTIACVGLYGTTAYAVARRTNEIGIRIALRAQRKIVIWIVQREVFTLSLAGLVIGLSIAWGASRYLASFLFGVRPNDLLVFGLSAVILILCAMGASYAPAWRASRINPVEALRNE